MTVEARSVRAPAPRTLPGRERWWVQPLLVAIGFSAFVVYSTWSVIFGGNTKWFEAGPYLSPFFSPWFRFGWWPFSSAILIAWAPLGFRATCYYYRKAYYRSFFLDPPACAIREPSLRKSYSGERRFPLILNNLHRFFLYLAIIVMAILWWDTISAFYYNGGLYIGVGSVLMLINVILITGYTFSCHALRHFVGGSVDCFSCARAGKARHGLWRFVTSINPYHGAWAWASLISVALVDVYIRLVAGGVFGSGCYSGHFGC